jgi:hypothetical protein
LMNEVYKVSELYLKLSDVLVDREVVSNGIWFKFEIS